MGGSSQEACRWEGFPVSRQQQGATEESNLNINSFRRGHFTTLPPIRDTDLSLGERAGFKLHFSVVIRSLSSLAFVCTENMVGQ